MFCVLPHQSSHQHWEQNEVHENLRGGEASLGAERPLWTALKHVGRIVQDMRDGSCSPISNGRSGKTFDQLLFDPDIQDQFAIPYPLGTPLKIPAVNEDPGRIRASSCRTAAAAP